MKIKPINARLIQIPNGEFHFIAAEKYPEVHKNVTFVRQVKKHFFGEILFKRFFFSVCEAGAKHCDLGQQIASLHDVAPSDERHARSALHDVFAECCHQSYLCEASIARLCSKHPAARLCRRKTTRCDNGRRRSKRCSDAAATQTVGVGWLVWLNEQLKVWLFFLVVCRACVVCRRVLCVLFVCLCCCKEWSVAGRERERRNNATATATARRLDRARARAEPFFIIGERARSCGGALLLRAPLPSAVLSYHSSSMRAFLFVKRRAVLRVFIFCMFLIALARVWLAHSALSFSSLFAKYRWLARQATRTNRALVPFSIS